jgi:hypothetical protein
MDGYEWSEKIVGSLAWPVTALLLAWMLRDPLSQRLAFLRKLKAGPIEAEFEREAKVLEALSTVVERPADVAIPSAAQSNSNSVEVQIAKPLEKSPPAAQESEARYTTEVQRRAIEQLASLNNVRTGISKRRPSAEILETWQRVAGRLQALIEESGLPVEVFSESTPMASLMYLSTIGVSIDPALRDIIKYLYSLKEQVSHEPNFEPSEGSVASYSVAADRALRTLNTLVHRARANAAVENSRDKRDDIARIREKWGE